MALIDHEGEALISDGGLAFYHPDEDVTLPGISLSGAVRVVDGIPLQDMVLGEPPEGWRWVVGPMSGPLRFLGHGAQTAVLGLDGFSHEACIAYIVSEDAVSRAVSLDLTWPGTGIIAPGLSLTPVTDREVDVGMTLAIACAPAFTGAPLTFRGETTVGGELPGGWALNAETGLLSVPTATAFAAQSVRVYAGNALGEVYVDFSVTVRTPVIPPVPALANIAPGVFEPDASPGIAVGSIWRAKAAAWSGGKPPFTDEWAFVLNGVVGAYSTTSSRAIIAADAGRVIGARARRTDSSVPPVSVTVTPAGVATIPAEPSASDYTVANSAELRAAMIAAAGFSGAKKITITGVNLGPMAALANCQKPGEPMTITAVGRSTHPSTQPTFLNTAGGSSNMLNLDRMRNIIWDGIYARNTARDGVAGHPTNPNGWPAAGPQFITCVNPQNVTWRNGVYRGWHRTGFVRESTNLRYEWCRFTECGMDDMFHANRQDGLVFWHNLYDNTDIDASREFDASGNRHSDASSIQTPSQPLPEANGRYGSRDVLAQGNTYKASTGRKQMNFWANPLGTTLADFNNPLIRHERITSRLNYILGGSVNAIFARNVKDLLIEDNVIHTFEGAQATARITLAGYGSGIVRRNVVAGIVAGNPAGSNLNQFSRTDNITISPSDRTTFGPILTAPLPCGPYAYE